ncbi:MAG: right-handed parallel beta-helix repeat-containing protein [Planctomycetes bacterium]|nr:right-handed parallel beta-helix repeat-containing protein [Planctomycetota bacterium]
MKIRSAPFLHIGLAVAAVLVSAQAHAADWFVDTAGADTNTGRAISSPLRTIQVAVNAAGPGDTIHLRGGTWREPVTFTRAGTAAAPIVLAAYGSETPILKGSVEVAGWVPGPTAGVWKKTGWTINSQQVLCDGLPLAQIGVPSAYYSGPASDGTTMIMPVGTGVADLVPGSFCYVGAEQAIYLRLADSSDPNARLVEVSTLRRILFMDTSAAFIVVRGLSFRHSSTAAFQQGGAAIELADNCILDRCDVQFCDFAGVAMGYQRTGSQVVNCVVSNHGNSGIGASGTRNFAIRGCTITDNNYRRFNTGWHAGGIKATANAWGVIERCTISRNRGVGAWFDYAASGNAIIVRANRFEGNFSNAAGIMFEASSNGLLVNNLVIDNDRRGIYVSASDNVNVWHNAVVGTRTQTAIDVSGMPRAGKSLRNIEVANNIVAGNLCQDDLMMVKENGTDIVDLRCDHNLFYRSSGPVSLWWGLDGRGGWSGTRYTSVSAWQTAFGARNSRQADPRFAAGGFIPMAGSPAIDAGILCVGVSSDHAGNARTAGPACDIGAYEQQQQVASGTTGGTTTSGSSTGGTTSSIATSGSGSAVSEGGTPTKAGGCGLGSGLALLALACALGLKNAVSWVRVD